MRSWQTPPPPERWSPYQSVPPAWRSLPSCWMGRRVLLKCIDHGVKISGVDVVVDIAIGIGNAGVFWTEAPLSVHDEFILV